MFGAVYTAFALSFTFAMSAVGATAILVDRSGARTQRVAQAWGKQLCRVCHVALAVQGGADVNWNQPLILMANHQSYFDIPVLFATLPRTCGMLAKKELYRIPVFRSAMKALGCVAIDRSNRRQSLDSLKEAAEQVRSGRSIVVFPEGTRSPDGLVHPLKKGPFYLTEMAEVPIVPVGIRGTRAVLSRDGVLVHPGSVQVTFGRPLMQTAKGHAGREQIRAEVFDALVELSGCGAAESPPITAQA